MITLKEWMEVVGYRITEGSDYGWDCYGSGAYCLDCWDGNQDGYSLTIIFDTGNQTVYEVQAHDYRNQRAYRFFNPEFADKYREHAKTLSSDAKQAWDDVNYVDLETEEDWLEKANAIVAGEDYDTRVSVPLEFTDEELLKYMTMAHERDMTFNEFIEDALRHAIEEAKLDPEGSKERAQKWLADRDQKTSHC